MATGYVKLHRESMEHAVFQDEWLWKVFCWCMMKANFRDTQDSRGSFTTGRLRAAEELHASPSRVYESWKRLEKLGCISLKANSNFTTISVCNYKTYQSDDDERATTKQQQSNSDPTTKQQQSNTDKEFQEGKNAKNANYVADGTSMAFQMAWSIFPAERRIKKQLASQAWLDAVGVLESRFDLRRDAEDWLLTRVRQYAESPVAKTKFCASIAKWLSAGSYDDPAEAWDRGDDQPIGPPPIAVAPPVPLKIPKANFTRDPYAEAANGK